MEILGVEVVGRLAKFVERWVHYTELLVPQPLPIIVISLVTIVSGASALFLDGS